MLLWPDESLQFLHLPRINITKFILLRQLRLGQTNLPYRNLCLYKLTHTINKKHTHTALSVHSLNTSRSHGPG